MNVCNWTYLEVGVVEANDIHDFTEIKCIYVASKIWLNYGFADLDWYTISKAYSNFYF